MSAQASFAAQDLERERVELSRSEERLGALILNAGVSGNLNLPRAQDLPERFVKKGQLLGYVLSSPPRIVRVVVSQDDIDLVRSRLKSISVKITDRVHETYSATLTREVPGGQISSLTRRFHWKGEETSEQIHGTQKDSSPWSVFFSSIWSCLNPL